MGKVEQGDVVKLNAMFTALDTDAAGRVDVGMLVARADAARERLEKSVGRPSLLPTHPGGRSGQRRASWRPTLLPSPRALEGRPTHVPDDGVSLPRPPARRPWESTRRLRERMDMTRRLQPTPEHYPLRHP